MPTAAEKRAEAKAAALEKQRLMKELFAQRKAAAAAKAAAEKVAKAAKAAAAKAAKDAKKICPNTGLPCPTPAPEPTPTPAPEPATGLPPGYYLDDVLDKIMPVDPTVDGWIIDENGRLQFAPIPVDYKEGDPPPKTWIKTDDGGITHGPLPAGWHYVEGGIERIIPQGWGIGENGELLGG